MDERWWANNCHKSGEQIARENDWDAGNTRRLIRKAKKKYPHLNWRDDPRHSTAYRVLSERPKRTVEPRVGQKVDTTLTVVCGDLHIPFHDENAVAVTLGWIRDNKPDMLIINGDFVDFYAVSRFAKDPDRELQLQDELDQANLVLDAFDAAMPKESQKQFVVGNHEARLMKYLRENARALHGLRALTLDALLRLTDRGYTLIPMVGRDASTHVGKVEIGHFDCARKGSGSSARVLLLDRGCSVVQGHTHRLSAIYKRQRGTGEQVGAWEAGCLCDLNPEYVTSPDWQQGFISMRSASGRYHISIHEILGGELLAGGRRY